MRTPSKNRVVLIFLIFAAGSFFLLRSLGVSVPSKSPAPQDSPASVFFTNRLDTLLAPEPPVVVRAGDRIFVATSAENEEPVLRALDGEGRVASRQAVAGLGTAVQACDVPPDALLLSEESFVRLGPDGTAAGPAAKLVDSPLGLKTFTVDDNVLAMASVEPGAAVYFRAYRLDGSPVREGASFAAGGAPSVRAGLARLGTGEYLVVWIDAGRLRYAVVSVVGEIKTEPVTFAEPAGGAKSLSVASDGSGNARIVWEEDSEAGGVFVRKAGRDGAIGDVLRLGEKGSSSPRLLKGGEKETVAWIGGKNNETLFIAANGGKAARLTAPGRIEAFDGTADGALSALAVTVRESDAYGVYAGFLEN